MALKAGYMGLLEEVIRDYKYEGLLSGELLCLFSKVMDDNRWKQFHTVYNEQLI